MGTATGDVSVGTVTGDTCMSAGAVTGDVSGSAVTVVMCPGV